MTTERFSNQASTTLASSVGAGDLSISVQGTAHFPTQPEFRIRIGQELMLVTGVAGTTWTVSRSIENTSASSHAAGTAVVAVLTAGALDELRAEIEAEDRTASGIRTASTVVAVSAATAPTAGQVLTATSGTAADWETLPAATESVPGTMSPVDKAKLNLFPNPSVGTLTSLPTDAATQIYDLPFSGLTSSKRYLTTVRSSITLSSTGNPTHFGTADLIFSVSLLVSSVGVITASIGNTPIESDHFSAGFFPTVSAVASTSHILFSATRPTGEQTVAQAAVYVDPILLVGDNLDSRLVAITYSQDSTAYSVDGVNWVAGGNMPTASGWDAIAYDSAHSLFVAMAYNSGGATATSANGGVTWVSAGGAGGTQASGMAYDAFHGKLIIVRSGFNTTSVSSDGSATWTAGGNLSAAIVWNGMIYNATTHRVHVLENAGTRHNYSDDGGTTWQVGAVLPASLGWSSGCHDLSRNRIVLTASGSNQTYYSDDDMATWHLGGTLSAVLSWGGCRYFASTGRIIVNAYNSDVVNYSDDGGITWQVGTSMPSVKNWQSMGVK